MTHFTHPEVPLTYRKCECIKCGSYLLYDFEHDQDMCGECQDREIYRSQQLKDWYEFHDEAPDEGSI